MDSPILVLLSGGKSTRMGSSKGLLDFHGKPWILEQIARYKHLENPRVYIGLGYDYEQYLNVIPWFKDAIENSYNYNGVEVRLIINYQPQFGSFSTLQTVLKKVNINSTVIILPIDVPLLNKQSLTSIVNENNTIVIPTCDAKNGHPVKLNSEFWNTLLTIDPSSKDARLDTQIKQLDSFSIAFVNVIDNSVYQNINTQEKWNSYLEIAKK